MTYSKWNRPWHILYAFRLTSGIYNSSTFCLCVYKHPLYELFPPNRSQKVTSANEIRSHLRTMLTTDIVNDAGQESFSSTNTILAFGFGVVQIYENFEKNRLLFSLLLIYLYVYKLYKQYNMYFLLPTIDAYKNLFWWLKPF